MGAQAKQHRHADRAKHVPMNSSEYSTRAKRTRPRGDVELAARPQHRAPEDLE